MRALDCSMDAKLGLLLSMAAVIIRLLGALPTNTVDGTSTAIGFNHICYLLPLPHPDLTYGGRAVCQGREEYGKTEAPEEEHFVQLVAGTYFTCGLTFDQRVRCWGRINAPPTEGLYLQLSAGSFYSCGLLIDGQIDCWGQSRVVTEVKNFAAQDRAAAHFEQISCGSETCCALNYEGKLHCWGALIVTNTTASEHASDRTLNNTVFTEEKQFISVQAGISEAAATNNEFDDIFSQISLGDSLACGILFSSGDLRCWGQIEKHSLRDIKKGPFIQVSVSAGRLGACALRQDLSMHCFGKAAGLVLFARRLNSTWSEIEVGASAVCALSSDRSLACGGGNGMGLKLASNILLA